MASPISTAAGTAQHPGCGGCYAKGEFNSCDVLLIKLLAGEGMEASDKKLLENIRSKFEGKTAKIPPECHKGYVGDDENALEMVRALLEKLV